MVSTPITNPKSQSQAFLASSSLMTFHTLVIILDGHTLDLVITQMSDFSEILFFNSRLSGYNHLFS